MNSILSSLAGAKPLTPLHLTHIPLVDRVAWILERVAGKSVLHVGATDFPETASVARRGQLLHLKLKQACKELVGVDLAESAIATLRKDYGIDDIICGDAEHLDTLFPPERFDVIVAGDVIEHMSNMGNFLQSARKVLRKDGRLLISVPNAFSIKRMLGAIFLRQERNNPDHLYFFSPMTLWQAASRFGFQITDIGSFMYETPRLALNRRGNQAAKVIMRLTGNNFLADELVVCMTPMDSAVNA